MWGVDSDCIPDVLLLDNLMQIESNEEQLANNTVNISTPYEIDLLIQSPHWQDEINMKILQKT